MGETFYTALGVGVNADTETIRRAYRDQVKETHPDVSNDPGAAEEFRRLTTARDVLVDSAERRRYDRLGHSVYVREHVSGSAWAVGSDRMTGSSPDETATERSTGTGNRDVRAAGTWYTNVETGRDPRSSGPETDHARQTSRADGAGGYGNADWQTASDAYRRTEVSVDDGTGSPAETVVGVANALGPWLFVHLSLLLSAVATGGFFLATGLNADVSLAALVGAGLLVVLVMALSALHILLQVY